MNKWKCILGTAMLLAADIFFCVVLWQSSVGDESLWDIVKFVHLFLAVLVVIVALGIGGTILIGECMEDNK